MIEETALEKKSASFQIYNVTAPISEYIAACSVDLESLHVNYKRICNDLLKMDYYFWFVYPHIHKMWCWQKCCWT